jgi:hypothetical protein
LQEQLNATQNIDPNAPTAPNSPQLNPTAPNSPQLNPTDPSSNNPDNTLRKGQLKRENAVFILDNNIEKDSLPDNSSDSERPTKRQKVENPQASSSRNTLD